MHHAYTGFVGFDTACQPKHYHELGLGAALRGLPRDSYFLQTKFTPPGGHNAQVPYDTTAFVEQQVAQSFAQSLRNLHTDHIDSLLMHSPMRDFEDTLRAWRAFESLHAGGVVRLLGISNVDLPTLERLYEAAVVKPTVVQNRFWNATDWDRPLRAFCNNHAIRYQGFWTLTAHSNRAVLRSPALREIAQRYGRPLVSVYYRALIQMGITVLDGTRDRAHMKEDVAVLQGGFVLTPEDVAVVDRMLALRQQPPLPQHQ